MITAALLPLVACAEAASSPGNEPGAGNRITASADLKFLPQTIAVARNEAVTRTFGSVSHNVTFSSVMGRPAHMEGFNTDTSVVRVVPEVGTFPFQCTLHAGMGGTVEVRTGPSTLPGGYSRFADHDAGPGDERPHTEAHDRRRL